MTELSSSAAGIWVLGMHRSGTSCLTALLETAGVSLGDVLRRNASNPHGTFERVDVQSLNEALLGRCGASWQSPVPVERAEGREVDALRDLVRSLEGLWALKDPRFVFTLDAWLPFVHEANEARVVACVRDPLAVADSLARRDGMLLGVGLKLWLQYNERVLERVDRDDIPVVSFDEEPEIYLEQVASLFERLGLPYHDSRVRGVFQPGPHSRGADGPLEADPRCRELYAALRERSLARSRKVRSAPRSAPEISVIIPTCDPGRASFLDEAVASVLGQAEDLELLVVLDGPDALPVEPAWVRDPRVRIHRQARAGTAAARNSGIWLARGEYLAFLDDDDLFREARFVDSLARLQQDSRLALVYGRAERVGEAAPRSWPSLGREGDISNALFFENFIPIPSVLVRRSVLVAAGGFDEAIELTDDWDLWLRIAALHPVAFCEGVLATHRRHDENASAERTRIQEAELCALHAYRRRDPAGFSSLGRRARKDIARRHLRLARRLQGVGQSRKAHHHYAQSLRFAPTLKATLNWLRTLRSPLHSRMDERSS